jgi:hypothetical protein
MAAQSKPQKPARRKEATEPAVAQEPSAPEVVEDFHIDLGHVDLGHIDLGHIDLGHFDLGHFDLGHFDLGHLDLGHFDLGHFDLGHFDLGHIDLGHFDLGHFDIPFFDIHFDIPFDDNGNGNGGDLEARAAATPEAHAIAMQASDVINRLGSVLQDREAESLARHQQTAQGVQEVVNRMNDTLGYLSTAIAQTFTDVHAKLRELDERVSALERPER